MKGSIGSRPWAGIDVGSFSVKLLATQGAAGAARVWTAESPLPPEPNGERNTTPEAVARALSECMDQTGLTPRSFRGVTMGISGVDVIVKQISLPLLEDNEVGPALRFEARKHLPFDPQAMVIDFQILGRYLSEKRIDVLLAAVAHDHLDRHLAPLALLDMNVDVVDATPLALTNAVALGREHEPGAHALLDLGHTCSHLTLYQRGEPYFSRRLDYGGRNLTRAISERVRVPFEEAEEWKHAAGADSPTLQVGWDQPEMRAMLDSLQRELADEVRRSFAFYRTLGTLPDPLPLRISGGTVRLPGLAARLEETLGVPVTVFHPPAAGNGARGPGPQFVQAWGLASRSA